MSTITAGPESKRRWFNFGRKMTIARGLVVLVGIVLPYAARVLGIPAHGLEWFIDYWDAGWEGMVLIGAFNAVCWGSILVATLFYRHVRSVWFPAVLGFSALVYLHATLDLAADAQAAIGMIFVPFVTLPFVFAGWLVGLAFDKLVFGDTPADSARADDTFSLRGLLIVITVLALMFGLLSWYWQYQQGRTREIIRQSVVNGELDPEDARPILGEEVDSLRPADN